MHFSSVDPEDRIELYCSKTGTLRFELQACNIPWLIFYVLAVSGEVGASSTARYTFIAEIGNVVSHPTESGGRDDGAQFRFARPDAPIVDQAAKER